LNKGRALRAIPITWSTTIATDRRARISVIVWRGAAMLVALLAAIFQTPTANAHHAFTAEFDVNKPVTLTGAISRTEWINPHVQLFLKVKAADGQVASWRVESWGTGNCRRAGLLRNKVPPGTLVTMQVYRAKDGTQNFGYLRSIQFEDGTTISLWVGGANGSPEEQGLL
jgi:hypothetical protein